MIFQVNFFGAVNLTRALLPHFRERRTGTVINISSISGVGSFPGMSSYGSVKAAMTCRFPPLPRLPISLS